MSDLTSLQKIGEAECMVEYEYTKGERAVFRDCSSSGPGFASYVTVTRIEVNGEYIDADNFAPHVISRLEQVIFEESAEEQAEMDDFFTEREAA
jgi:hypothetical protein